ncbi:hypothetical protein EV138_2000 [Kribbella voronezhensis]|uniref:SnoaL-like protein n=1 Tax=Kribbella voronezhensis TaxID=2512212 RepID=A0A4R7T9B4_9ACTN|nr:hypothetical protein [Kribbella voronezhensis]TDU88455.1 hypothetical protein EV138_2000 [Kribbella voronezhensis]
MIDSSTRDLVARYVGVWGEPDAERRRRTIEELWTENGTHLLHPPEEIRAAAGGLGFAATTLTATGYDELEARVARSYEEFVADGKYIFRPRDNAVRLDDLVRFSWEMVSTADGEVVGEGLEILLIDSDRRIRTDYQFPNP